MNNHIKIEKELKILAFNLEALDMRVRLGKIY